MCRSWKRLMLLVLALTLLSFPGCGSSGKEARTLGNTNANILNAGMSVIWDGWLYFANYADGNGLYRMRPDGSEEEKVSDDMAYSLNVFGDWLYYVSGNEQNTICKMRGDGSGKTVVGTDAVRNLVVTEEWIYYINQGYGDEKAGDALIYKMRPDGTGREPVNQQETSAFSLEGEWIYYGTAEDMKIRKIMTDGSGEAPVGDVAVTAFCIEEGTLYYIDAVEESHRIWKMKTDGTEAVQLSDDKVSVFNVSEGWIYYGHALGEEEMEMDLELKKMRTDGIEATVLNEDDAVLICAHDDLLVYLSVSFTDLFDIRIQETVMRTDGTGRKDFTVAPAPPAQDVARYAMNEPVTVEEVTYTVTSAYSTNIWESTTPGFESPIFDDVTDGAYLFVNVTVTNRGSSPVDLKEWIGQIEDIDAMGLSVYWSLVRDVTLLEGKGDSTFHLAREAYEDSTGYGIRLAAGETKDVQCLFMPPEASYPVFLGLFHGMGSEAAAAIEVTPTETRYVTSWGQSMQLMEARFPDREILQKNGMGFLMEGDEEERMFYTFEVRTSDGAVEHYLVERDTGAIYVGAYDAAYPDYDAVPLRRLEPEGASDTGENENANLMNDGFSLYMEDWIYVSEEGLWRMRQDGTGKMAVTDDGAFYLQALAGWIYYINFNEGGGIYRIRPDGTERTRISDAEALYLVGQGEWLYYLDYTPVLADREQRPELCRMKRDGTEVQTLMEMDGPRFDLEGDWVYFTKDMESGVFKVRIDGTGMEKVLDKGVRRFMVQGSAIYYEGTAEFGESDMGLWRADLDGANPRRLTTEVLKAMNISGNWIYYSNELEGGPGPVALKRMRTDGTQAAVLLTEDVYMINVHGDWIVCSVRDQANMRLKTILLRTDGTQPSELMVRELPKP